MYHFYISAANYHENYFKRQEVLRNSLEPRRRDKEVFGRHYLKEQLSSVSQHKTHEEETFDYKNP